MLGCPSSTNQWEPSRNKAYRNSWSPKTPKTHGAPKALNLQILETRVLRSRKKALMSETTPKTESCRLARTLEPVPDCGGIYPAFGFLENEL